MSLVAILNRVAQFNPPINRPYSLNKLTKLSLLVQINIQNRFLT